MNSSRSNFTLSPLFFGIILTTGCMKAEKIAFDTSTPSGAIVSMAAGVLSSSGSNGTGTPATYSVGGTITGYTGSGLILQNNGGDDLTVPAGATTFTFATPVADGGAYSVQAIANPTNPNQTCTPSANTGSVSRANVITVNIVCSTVTYTISGNLIGYSGSGLVLQNNGGDNLTIPAGATTFQFSTPVADGGAYKITVSQLPINPPQTCSVTGGSVPPDGGNVAGQNVSLTVNCIYSGAQFVAVGDNGNAWYSYDGMTWTATTYPFSGSTSSMQSVVFSGSKWVTVGNYKDAAGAPFCAVWSSYDGITWTKGTCPAGILPLTGVAYGNGMFLAGGGVPSTGLAPIMKSLDGLNWTLASSNISLPCSACPSMSSIAYEPTSATFVTHFSTFGLYKSADGGASWAPLTGPVNFSVNKVFPGPTGKIMVLGIVAGFYTTVIGDVAGVWGTAMGNMVAGTNTQNSVAHGNGLYMDVGNFCNSYYYDAGKGVWYNRSLDLTLGNECGTQTYDWLTVKYHSKSNLFVSGGKSLSGNARFIYSNNGILWNSGTLFTTTSPVNAIGVAE